MQILLKFAANIDKDLGHLSRLAGPCALSLGSGHPKTLWGTFFSPQIPQSIPWESNKGHCSGLTKRV